MPVAEQGASSKTASAAASGSQWRISPCTISAARHVRARLSRRRARRFALESTAATLHPAAASCIVLPPGAAHRSRLRRLLPSPKSCDGRLRWEERRVWKEVVSTERTRGAPSEQKKQ